MQKSFLGSGIPISVPQTTTSLANLSDVNLTTPANSQVLTFSGSKWINAPAQGSQVSSVFGRVGAVVKNVNDYAITDIQNNSYLASDQNLTVASPLTGQTIRYDGAKFLNSKLSIDDLSNTSITTPQEADSLIYSSVGLGSWKNQKKYSEFFIYQSIAPGSTITAVNKTIYFCNLATINFPASVIGECVKVINTNGPLLTINFPGRILYFNFNNFNATLTTTESCEIEFEGILGGNWQIKSFTGKILNSVTGKNLANNDLNDLRNVTITTPSVGQVVSWNGSNFVNSTLPSIPVSSVFGRTGAVVATEGDYSLNLLSDVTITTPVNNNILSYNGSVWVNSTLPSIPVSSVFGRTGTVVATEGDYSLNLLSDVTITTPVNNNILSYNGSVWVNGTRTSSFQYNSDGNLSNGQFLYPGWGQNNTEARTQVLLPYNITLTEFNIFLSAAPGTGNSRIFTIRTNGNIQTAITISGTSATLTQPINVICTAGQLLSIQNIAVGAAAALGIFNLKYFFN